MSYIVSWLCYVKQNVERRVAWNPEKKPPIQNTIRMIVKMSSWKFCKFFTFFAINNKILFDNNNKNWT